MAYEEKKLEICSKHGISTSELSRLVCLKIDEKEVTEDKALDLVKADLEKKYSNPNKPSKSFIESINAEEYLVDYAKRHHPDDPDWYKKVLEKEYKSERYGIHEEDAIRIAAMSYGWKPEGEEDPWAEIDNLSEKSLSSKIRNRYIDRLTARINRISTERPYKWDHKYRVRTRGVELTDGNFSIWVNCCDTSMFINESGDMIPANPMLERIRALEARSNLIGAVVTITNIETGRNKKGLTTLTTGPDSDFLLTSEEFIEIQAKAESIGVDA